MAVKFVRLINWHRGVLGELSCVISKIGYLRVGTLENWNWQQGKIGHTKDTLSSVIKKNGWIVLPELNKGATPPRKKKEKIGEGWAVVVRKRKQNFYLNNMMRWVLGPVYPFSNAEVDEILACYR